MKEFFINSSKVLSKPGESQEIKITGSLEDLSNPYCQVDPKTEIVCEGNLTAISGGVVLKGSIEFEWTGECKRCLEKFVREVRLEVNETFERNYKEGDTYPLDRDGIDLEPLIRDAVLIELPSLPLCSDDCLGLCIECGANRNVTKCVHCDG